jgi:allantoinase
MNQDRLTYPHRRRGLDHDWFPHQAIIKRAPIIWPEGRRVALNITVHLEFFPMDASASPVRPLGTLDRGYPDYWSYSNRDYGTRVGIYRIMRVLDELGLRATAAVNAAVATRYPRVIDELLHRDWEFMASGVDMGHAHHGILSVHDERTLLCEARDTLTGTAGGPIVGWHSPGHSQSPHTLQLLAESGFEYVTDWSNDDLPYMMSTASGQICSLPLTYDWSDRVLLAHHNLTVEDYEAQVLEAFHRLHSEAGQHRCGRVLSLSISPWVLGYPHRIGALKRVLTRMMEAGSVWPATGKEIVATFKSQILGHHST